MRHTILIALLMSSLSWSPAAITGLPSVGIRLHPICLDGVMACLPRPNPVLA